MIKIKLHLLKTWIIIILTFLTLGLDARHNPTGLSDKTAKIVAKLEKGTSVHFGYAVGYAARPETKNKYYKLYLRLKRHATNQELILLTNSSSKNIVVYAFNILHSRKYEGLKEVFIRHLNDTTFFWTAGGCTGFVERVNWFMLRRLNPSIQEQAKSYLTKNEYEMYCSQFHKEDQHFLCQ